MTQYRFDQIAENLTVRVEPGDTDLERYVGLEHLDHESLRLRRWGSPSDVIGQKLRFWKGDIIYGKRRAYQRKLAVADFDGICSAHAMVLRAKQDVISRIATVLSAERVVSSTRFGNFGWFAFADD